MQKIPNDATPQEVRKGVITEVADVEADEEVADLAPAYRTQVSEYSALYRQIDPLEEEWIWADARLKVLDRRLDGVVKAFRLDLVQRSGNKLTGPLFDRYLPEGLRAVTEAEMAQAEPAQVQDIENKLTADGGELAETWLPRLTTARQAVVDQAVVRHGVEVRQDNLERLIESKINTLQEARVALNGNLRIHFKSDPSRAEVFFYSWRPRRPKKLPLAVSDSTGTPS